MWGASAPKQVEVAVQAAVRLVLVWNFDLFVGLRLSLKYNKTRLDSRAPHTCPFSFGFRAFELPRQECLSFAR